VDLDRLNDQPWQTTDSCMQGIARKEFIKKVLLKAAQAGTLAAVLEVGAIRIHPVHAATSNVDI
jgi:hypothetical protein